MVVQPLPMVEYECNTMFGFIIRMCLIAPDVCTIFSLFFIEVSYALLCYPKKLQIDMGLKEDNEISDGFC